MLHIPRRWIHTVCDSWNDPQGHRKVIGNEVIL